MSARDELNQIIEFAGRPPKGVKTSGSVTKFISKHGGKLAAGAGIAAGVGLTVAASRHLEKQKQWRANAGDKDFLDLTGDLVVDKHGAMLPKNHPSVVGGNIHRLSARQQLDQIINFDAATMIADKLAKVAWDKVGQGALRYGGMGAIGGAVIGGAQGAANGDIVGGAASGAMSGGMLGAAGGALHSAGAFKGLMGTEEQIAARAAKKAAAGKVATPATPATPAAPKPSAYEGMPDDALVPQVNNPRTPRPAKQPIQKREPVLGGYNARPVSAVPPRAFEPGGLTSAPRGPQLPTATSRFPDDDPRRRIAASAREELDSIIQLAAWTRKEGKSRSGGLNEKGRKSYERENPGSDLKAPSKEAGNPRRASFCARMSGMKKKLTSSKTANDPDSRINKSLKAWNCSAREELNTILLAKKGGDYKRHWSQKKTDRKGKKKCADCGETPCECHTYSAREELDVIQFGLGSLLTGAGKKLGSVAGDLAIPDALGSLGGQLVQGAKFATMGGVRGITSGLKAGAEDAGGAIKNLWGKLKPAKSAYAPGMNPFQNSMVHASARDQLNTILMGVDVRPRDPMGRFDQAEDGAPNPQHMKVVYAAPQEQAPPSITGKNMGKLAAGGAAFMGGGMALQHVIEKLKKLKKK